VTDTTVTGHEATQLERLAASCAGYDARPGATEGLTPGQVVINATSRMSHVLDVKDREHIVHLVSGGSLEVADLDRLVKRVEYVLARQRKHGRQDRHRLPAGDHYEQPRR
jgi:hypothetical protein